MQSTAKAEYSARFIAQLVHGKVTGDPDVTVFEVSRIEDAKTGSLTFLANPKYESHIYKTEASIVLVDKQFLPKEKLNPTLIAVNNPYEALSTLLEMYEKKRQIRNGISKRCSIDESARIGSDVYVGDFTCISENTEIADNVKIHPQVFIGSNVSIGENTIVYAGVKIYQDTRIGRNCIIHSGVVLGSDGFGFTKQSDGTHKKIPQLGNVIVGDNVEIGANVTIDRATIGSTIIKDGVKFDNQVQVAHNVEIGENTILIGQVGIAGSSKVGKNCILSGQVGIVGHISICDDVIIGAQSGVTRDIKEKGAIVLGSPAKNASREKRSIAVYGMLPELHKQINELTEKVDSLLAD